MNPMAVTTAESLVPTSPFAGADICREAGLAFPPGAPKPVFEDDEWDFTHVIGLPVQLGLGKRRLDFALIRDPRWRLVAKELFTAMLAPRHEAVAALPRAYRTPLHIATAKNRLDELTRLQLAHPAGHRQPRRGGRRLLRCLAGASPSCPRRGWHRDLRQWSRHAAGCGPDRHRPGQLPRAVHRRPGSPPSTTRSPASAPRTSTPPRSASCRPPSRIQRHAPEPHRLHQ